MQPLFVLSLPRSGSTMLQRELARHPAIATASEPWFLLGLLAPSSVDLATSSFGYGNYRLAVEDVIAGLPNGIDDWNAAVGGAARAIYSALASTANSGDPPAFFLDKTPRYALAPEAIRAVFPDAPIIILWRNPVAVAASMMSTWSHGRWNLDRFSQDFHLALPRLVAFVQNRPERVLALRYEDVVADLPAARDRVFEFLGLSAEIGDRLTAAETVALGGRMGDPTGGLNKKALQSEDDRWKALFSNPIRRAWARRFLRRFGEDRLDVMGYELKTLEGELNSCKGTTKRLASDMLLIPTGYLRNLLAVPLVLAQLLRLREHLPPIAME